MILLCGNLQGFYARYIAVPKVMMKNERFWTLLVNLSKNAPVVKSLSINPLDDPCVNISSEENIIIVFEAADVLV